MERKGYINRILSFSSVDGPGNRSVIFMQGCNFNCMYCHNPETIQACTNCGKCVTYCKSNALTIEKDRVIYHAENCVQCDECIHHCQNSSSPKTLLLTASETVEILEKNLPYIRGVTVSGGECTMQIEYLHELTEQLQEKKLPVLLDSNGSYPFYEDEQLMEGLEGVMLDIKAYDSIAHKKITGKENIVVLKNLEYLASTKKLYEVRTVVALDAGGLFHAEETIIQAAEKLRPYLASQAIRYKIIAYRPMGVRREYRDILKTPEKELLEKLKQLAIQHGVENVLLI